MKARRLIRIIFFWTIIALFALVGCAKQAVQTQGEKSAAPEGSQITVKGNIDFMQNLGGYFVRGLEPGGELFIMNQNPQVLEALFKSGKTVIIEGRIVRGAEYLFIEKIDGQPYQGVEKLVPK